MNSPLLVKSKQFALDIIKVKVKKAKVYLQINLFAVEQVSVQISGKMTSHR